MFIHRSEMLCAFSFFLKMLFLLKLKKEIVKDDGFFLSNTNHVVALLRHQRAPFIDFRCVKANLTRLLAQESSPSHLSVSSVEQRLLELNRQSAAARSRLLELIEQQRQNVSANVSPCDSPIPPSAFSPRAAGSFSL